MKRILVIAVGLLCGACSTLPTSTEWLARADGYLKDGKQQKAIAAYNRAIALNPNNLEAYSSRGAAHFFAGDFALAEADFKYVLTKNPHHADVYTALGSAFAAQGDYGSALNMFNQAIALKPSRPENFVSRAGAYFMQGRYKEALEDYSAVLKYYPAADVFQARGMVYFQMGNETLAQQDFKAAKNPSIPAKLEVYSQMK